MQATDELRDPVAFRRLLLITGLLGALGALIVGSGEFLMQFSAQGGYEAADYAYFARVSMARLRLGHFLGALAAPLYLAGYAHIFLALRPAPAWLRWSVLLLGVYGFVIGDVWLGSRIYLALLVHAGADASSSLSGLLTQAAAFNEPLIQVVRVAIALASVLFGAAVLSGRSLYPRWIAACNPIVWLALVFLSYRFIPSIGVYLLPTAMNVAHFIFFALSVLILRQRA